MIQLQRGEKRPLTELVGNPSGPLEVTLRHDLQGADVSVFGLNADRRLQDDRYFVFYNQLSSPGDEIALTPQPWGGTFRLDLGRLPASVRRLTFVVTHDAAPFSHLGRLDWTLARRGEAPGAGVELRGAAFGSERAVMVAELYEHNGAWRVTNVGQGFSGGLDALLAHFGGEAEAGGHAASPVSAPPTPVQAVPFSPAPSPRPADPPPPSGPGLAPAADGTSSLSQFLAKTAEADRPGETFELENDKMLEVKVGLPGGPGRVWSKLGAMVAYSGNLSFRREGLLEGGVMKALVRAVSREMEPLARIEGQGVCYLADQAKEITLLRLTGDAVNVAGHALLAFEDTVQHEVAMHRSAAGMVSGGLFSVLLRGQGMLALLSHGRPLTLRVTGGETVYTDPNATIAWSEHLTPHLRIDSSLKSVFGRGGGETCQMAFQGEGFVVVQPYEENLH